MKKRNPEYFSKIAPDLLCLGLVHNCVLTPRQSRSARKGKNVLVIQLTPALTFFKGPSEICC